jgi:hypothetical protein
MRRLSFLTAPGSYLIIMILFFTSCNENKSSEANTDTADSITKTTMPGDNKTGILTGSLDTLIIDSASFAALGKPPNPGNWTIFRYYITSSNYITLAGWSANNSNGQYHGNNAPPPSPNIVLAIDNPSSIQYGPGNYFGNLILRPNQLTQIQRLLDSTHSKSVLFAPFVDNNQITYRIYLSDKTTAKKFSVNVLPTGQDLNPSPPRNSD